MLVVKVKTTTATAYEYLASTLEGHQTLDTICAMIK